MTLIGANGQLFGWAESTWLWLDQIGILGGDIMLVITVLGGIWAIINRNRIRAWLRRYRFPVAGDQAGSGETWDALIFTVSRADLPQWVIEQKTPAAVGVIASAQSQAEADQITRLAQKRGMTIGAAVVSDPDDPAEARAAAKQLVRQLREQGHQRIAIDITGGKTPMSLGAFMAAQEEGCDTLYVTAKYNDKLNKPDTGSAVIRCITRAENL